MRIRITDSFITANGPVNAGQELECPDDKAQELIGLGRAVVIGITGLLRTFDAYTSTNGMASLDIADASNFSSELMITGPVTDTPGA